MSYYIWGPTSYRDYLHNISTGIQDTRKTVTIEVPSQTREIIASQAVLAQENFHLLEASTERIAMALQEGFERLSYQLEAIPAALHELNATFNWCFSAVLAELGHMRDTLSELVKIAKTPIQTVAYNHFEIARDAFRQGLYQECHEELDKAINGDHTSSGYKLEWRFHHLMGTLQLGFADGDLALMDLPQAEGAFLRAARYAKTDYPHDAGHALLAAGWVAYCQGKLQEALTHTEQALALYPGLGEAHFQVAKVYMAIGEIASAFPYLEKAIKVDPRYALKAAGDGDFQKYEDTLRMFLEEFRQKEYRERVSLLRTIVEKAKSRRIEQLENLLAKWAQLPLLDLLRVDFPLTAAEEAVLLQLYPPNCPN